LYQRIKKNVSAFTLMGLLSLINVVNAESTSSSCLAYVQKQAQTLVKKPYQAIPDMGEEVRNLSYHDYQNIHFISGKTLWRKEQLPFQMEFMHPGMQFNQAIKLHIWENNNSTPIPFSRKYFHYAGLDRYFDKSPLDYTGFRLLYPISKNKLHNEFLVFQGASYFRSRGRDETYGLSARGLALNTHSNVPEEFPTYTHFWIEKPQKNSTHLRICGLLDSPSLTGASEFIIEPKDTTTMTVDTVIYPRKPLKELGIAPLTSMFFHGENALSTYGDYRPEVHDSDGLLIKHQNKNWHWHPLREAEWVEVKEFNQGLPQGFGLLQRDRNFDHYQDINADYQLRTSAWIEPLNDWGKGQLKLVQHSTDSDIQDNVVTYWRPKEVSFGQHFKYRIHWGTPPITQHALGKIHATRIASRDAERVLDKKKLIRFIIDIIDVEKTGATPTITTQLSGKGRFTFQAIQANPHIRNGWRVLLYLQTEHCEPPPTLSMRLSNEKNQQALSETWFYQLPTSLCQTAQAQ